MNTTEKDATRKQLNKEAVRKHRAKKDDTDVRVEVTIKRWHKEKLKQYAKRYCQK